MKKKWIVTIPYCEVEIEAEDEEEALELAYDEIQGDCDVDEVIENRKETYPVLARQDQLYYIYLLYMYSDTTWTGERDGITYISDGHRIYTTKRPLRCDTADEMLNTIIKNINYPRDEMDWVPIIPDEVQQLIPDVKYFSFELNGVEHTFRAIWLLEALYYTDSATVYVGRTPDSGLYLYGNDVAAMILPAPKN